LSTVRPANFGCPSARFSDPLRHIFRSRSGRWGLAAFWGLAGIAVAGLAVRHYAGAPWPLAHAQPALLVAVGLLTLVAYAFKAYGWGRLFTADERPRALALAAANGAASVGGVALPGRFDDAIRIAVVRRSPGCPAGVPSLCFSLVMLGLVDSAALAPLALVAALLPGSPTALRAGLALVALAGLAAAGLIFALPRLVESRRVLRFRLGRWLGPRTTSPLEASRALALVSACWLTRAAALFLLLAALGVGYAFPLALLVLCAGAAAAALPVGPAGAATQAGASAAVLVASGMVASTALGVAVGIQAVGVLCGGAIVVFAAVARRARGTVVARPESPQASAEASAETDAENEGMPPRPESTSGALLGQGMRT
jgi:uncharacterized membrane protein YbhN (UPF0104 family)